MTDITDQLARALRVAFGDLGKPASPPSKKRWVKAPRKTVFVGEDAPTSHADAGEMDLDLTIAWYTDGTHTEAQIIDNNGDGEGHVARGVALRRRGEKRDPELARALSLSRAFQDLADQYRKVAEDKLR